MHIKRVIYEDYFQKNAIPRKFSVSPYMAGNNYGGPALVKNEIAQIAHIAHAFKRDRERERERASQRERVRAWMRSLR